MPYDLTLDKTAVTPSVLELQLLCMLFDVTDPHEALLQG
jgi:hypothetical protein